MWGWAKSKARASTLPPPAEPFDEAFQRKLEVLSLVARKLATGRNRAERRSSKTGGGVEFAEHRPYAAGDDFRFLDWKVFGRSDRLLVKQFEEEEDLTVYLLLDSSSSMASGVAPNLSKIDYARRVAAALGYVALAGLDRVSVQAYTDKLGPRLAPTRGKNRALRMLRFLEEVQADGQTNTAQAMRSFVAREGRRGMAVILSDVYDPESFRQGVNSLRYAKFEPVLLHVYDPQEARPQLHGDLRLVDAESGETRDVTVTEALLRRFEQAHAAHMEAVSEFCREKQVPYFAMPTDRPFDEAVLQVLRRGGLLA